MSENSSYYRFREELFRAILRMQGKVNPPIIKPKSTYSNVSINS
jgi:hypothetical protein